MAPLGNSWVSNSQKGKISNKLLLMKLSCERRLWNICHVRRSFSRVGLIKIRFQRSRSVSRERNRGVYQYIWKAVLYTDFEFTTLLVIKYMQLDSVINFLAVASLQAPPNFDGWEISDKTNFLKRPILIILALECFFNSYKYTSWIREQIFFGN